MTRQIVLLSLIVVTLLLMSSLTVLIIAVPPASAQKAPPQLPVLSQGAQQIPREQRNSEYTGKSSVGGNYNPQTVITKENVHLLEMKWVYPIPSGSKIGGQNLVGFGNYLEGTMAPPVIVDGVAYIILNSKTVLAVDAKTGKQIWITPINASNTANSIQAGGRLPITTESSHTHGVNYIDGLLWFADYGCKMTALDPKTGKIARQFKDLCLEIPINDPRGVGIPTNSGWYGSLFPFPPVTYKAGNLIFYSAGGASEGTFGGRLYFAAYDLGTGKLVWRTFLVPPCGDPKTCGPGKDGPLFAEEKKQWGQWLVDNCNRIWIQQIKACELDRELLRNDWGDMRSNSGSSQIWMTPLVDEATGIVYIGTAQPGPDWNATYSPGFRLFGSSVLALNAKTGEIIWAHQTTARDLWDYDCSWNGVFANTRVKGQMKTVVMKGCKNGVVYIFDAATGEALHVLDPPSIKRTPHAQFLNPRSREDMLKPWQQYPSKERVWQNCPGTGCLEADIAFDPTRNKVYFATYNRPGLLQILPVEIRGSFGVRFLSDVYHMNNYTLNAYDVDTGKLVWEFHQPEGPGYRGGLIVSGGVVYPITIDGVFRGLDADTGKVLFERIEGTPSVVPFSIGADSDGRMLLFRSIGGRGDWRGPDIPGAVMAFGLPDKLPQPADVAREALKQVPKEQLKDVLKDVPKEALPQAAPTAETISPISYGIVGVGIVLIVISGILFSRRKKG